MNFSDYLDTCCTIFDFNVEGSNMPLHIDVLDVDYFLPLLSTELSYEEYQTLYDVAFRLINCHYNDVK